MRLRARPERRPRWKRRRSRQSGRTRKSGGGTWKKRPPRPPRGQRRRLLRPRRRRQQPRRRRPRRGRRRRRPPSQPWRTASNHCEKTAARGGGGVTSKCSVGPYFPRGLGHATAVGRCNQRTNTRARVASGSIDVGEELASVEVKMRCDCGSRFELRFLSPPPPDPRGNYATSQQQKCRRPTPLRLFSPFSSHLHLLVRHMKVEKKEQKIKKLLILFFTSSLLPPFPPRGEDG